MSIMNTVFANTDFVAEAENYISQDMVEYPEILEDVRECLAEYDATEDDAREYALKIMNVINARRALEEKVLKEMR